MPTVRHYKLYKLGVPQTPSNLKFFEQIEYIFSNMENYEDEDKDPRTSVMFCFMSTLPEIFGTAILGLNKKLSVIHIRYSILSYFTGLDEKTLIKSEPLLLSLIEMFTGVQGIKCFNLTSSYVFNKIEKSYKEFKSQVI